VNAPSDHFEWLVQQYDNHKELATRTHVQVSELPSSKLTALPDTSPRMLANVTAVAITVPLP
jgi:hypothetical protein